MVEYHPIDLRKWKIFNFVDETTLNSVVLVHVFGCFAESAYFVTAQDEVFAIGENIYGRLGIGVELSTEKPYRLDCLCGKFVTCFATGSIHTLALTKDGDVYAWGSTTFGQGGSGAEECQDTPLQVPFPASAGKIQQISSADRYCLALTENNELYHWGDILWESSSRQTTPLPIKLKYDLKIATINCGGFHASAITTCGKLLMWGVNEVGQLGIGNMTIEIEPTLVGGQLADQIILKVACSPVTTHALTAEGNLYAWGYNKSSSLCVGSQDEIVKFPQRVIFRNNISDISCNNLKNLLCAEVQNPHEVYLWILDEDNKLETLKLNNNNMLEAFADEPMPVVRRRNDVPIIVKSPRPSSPKYYPSNKMPRDIEGKLFNVKDDSDLTIKLADGEVFVHSLILKTFSDHFRTLLGKNWSSGNAVIDMSQYNPKAYRAFLKYIYSGFVEHLEGEEIIALCDIASSYLENDLENLCTEMFKKCLNIKNVANLYVLAASSHFEELVAYCILFSSKCLDDVILSKGFETCDPEHCKALVLNATKLKYGI